MKLINFKTGAEFEHKLMLNLFQNFVVMFLLKLVLKLLVYLMNYWKHISVVVENW